MQRAQRCVPENDLMVLGLPGSVEKEGYSPCTLGLELLAIFTSACSATSVVKFFIFCAMRHAFCAGRSDGGERIRWLLR